MAADTANNMGSARWAIKRSYRGLSLPGAQRSLGGMDSDVEADQIKRAAAGDPAAVRAIVVRHTARLHALAFRMMRSQEDAEDVVQEAFLRAWKVLPRWEPKAKLSTWLHRVTLNLCYDRLRKTREQLHADPPEMVDPAPLPDTILQSQQIADRLHMALAQLPDRQRAALSLCALEGHSNREAADILEVSVEALESLLSRGRRQLRSRLTELEGETR